MTYVEIDLVVNGQAFHAEVEARTSLVDLLRHHLKLTGTHVGCEQGFCGACTVDVDGDVVRSCLMLAAQADGCDITTIDGLDQSGKLHHVQAAFKDAVSFQCAFCAPGFIMSTRALLSDNKSPSDAEIRETLAGNLCRCTGYASIIAGVRLAADRLSGPAATDEALDE